MSEVTQLLQAASTGDSRAAAELLPLVYDELRRLAAHRLALRSALQGVNAHDGELLMRLDGDHAHLERLYLRAGNGELDAQGGLQVAAERFKEDAVSLGEFADKEGNEVCRRLVQQFERQRKESLDLVRIIEDAASVEVLL